MARSRSRDEWARWVTKWRSSGLSGDAACGGARPERVVPVPVGTTAGRGERGGSWSSERWGKPRHHRWCPSRSSSEEGESCASSARSTLTNSAPCSRSSRNVDACRPARVLIAFGISFVSFFVVWMQSSEPRSPVAAEACNRHSHIDSNVDLTFVDTEGY